MLVYVQMLLKSYSFLLTLEAINVLLRSVAVFILIQVGEILITY